MRPDITFAVNKACQYLKDPKAKLCHWSAVKRIFKYFLRSLDYGLFYGRNGNPILEGYSDADYAGDTDDRKSTSLFVFLQGDYWMSRKHGCVAVSATEAEDTAADRSVRQLMWLKLIGCRTLMGVCHKDNWSRKVQRQSKTV